LKIEYKFEEKQKVFFAFCQHFLHNKALKIS